MDKPKRVTQVSQERVVAWDQTEDFVRRLKKTPKRAAYACNNKTVSGLSCKFILGAGKEKLAVRVKELEFGAGGLGFRVFPSALLLSRFVVLHRHLFEGSSVLELGSGVGLAGLTAALIGAQTTLTDFLPALLTNLAQGMRRNGLRAPGCRVRLVDWAHDCLDTTEPSPKHTNLDRLRRLEPPSQPSQPEASTSPTYSLFPSPLATPTSIPSTPPMSPPLLGLTSPPGLDTEMCDALNPLSSSEQFDFVLGADIAYEPEYAEWLPKVVAKRLKKNGMFVAVLPVRDVDIINGFLQAFVDVRCFRNLQIKRLSAMCTEVGCCGKEGGGEEKRGRNEKNNDKQSNNNGNKTESKEEDKKSDKMEKKTDDDDDNNGNKRWRCVLGLPNCKPDFSPSTDYSEDDCVFFLAVRA